MKDIEEKERTTWFLDTNAYELYCNNNFCEVVYPDRNLTPTSL